MATAAAGDWTFTRAAASSPPDGEIALAPLPRSPGASGTIRMVTLARAPAARAPSWQVMGTLVVQLPWLGAASNTMTGAPGVSVTTTLGAGPGPLLAATIVYVTTR